LADTPTPPKGKTAAFDFSPTHISGEDYLAVKAERDDFIKKQEAASNEFMYQHYARLLRAAEKSYERAQHVNIVLERKERRKQTKERRDALAAQKKQAGSR